MAEEVRYIEVICLRDTASELDYFYKGQKYTVPSNHPCMQHFEPLRDVSAKEVNERAMDERKPDPYRGDPAPLPRAEKDPQYRDDHKIMVTVPKDVPKKKGRPPKKTAE